MPVRSVPGKEKFAGKVWQGHLAPQAVAGMMPAPRSHQPDCRHSERSAP